MDFLEGLNPRQREAVEHSEGPLLVLAGAGSGKTRVITHRIAHLMTAFRVPGWAVLAVTFTNKAAGEMRDRVRSLVATGPEGAPTVATFHSFCVRLLRRDGAPLGQLRRGFTPLFTIYDDDDQISMIKSIYKALGLDDKFMQPRAALSRISHAKSHQQSPEEIARAATDPTTTRFATVYERYEARLRESNALDFDDLLLEAVNLLRHDDATRQRLNQRYEFVMVDEYQDTNRSQYDLMRLLTEQRHNICVVGDEDQSIYGWRGANIRNILDFERDFPGATIIRLEQNYRSTQTILEAASAVVAHNTERIGKTLWTDSGAGEKITLYEAPDSENEALWIADTVENRLARNPQERVAVLYRTNSQSRQIEEALRRYGRKYVVVGGFSFYQRAEVKDILAYLKVLVSPHDSIGLLRIINTPARGIGRTTLEQIEQYALQHELSLWSSLEQMLEAHAFPGRAEAALAAFHRMMTELAGQLETRPISDTLADVLERTGYRKMLEDEGTEEARQRLANLDELLNAAADAGERGETPARFSGPRRAGLRRRFRRLARARFAAHHAQRQGPGIPGGVHRGPGRRTVPAQPLARFGKRNGGRAPPVLRRHDALGNQTVFELGPLPPPLRRRAAGSFAGLPLPEGGAAQPGRRRSRRSAASPFGGPLFRTLPGPRIRSAEPLYWEDLQFCRKHPAVFFGTRHAGAPGDCPAGGRCERGPERGSGRRRFPSLRRRVPRNWGRVPRWNTPSGAAERSCAWKVRAKIRK